MKKRRPLFWQLYFNYLFLTVIVLGTMTTLTYFGLQRFHLEQTKKKLLSYASISESQLKNKFLRREKNFLQDHASLLGQSTHTRMTYLSATGDVLADSKRSPSEMDSHKNRPEWQSALKTGYGEAVRFSKTLGQTLIYVAVRVSGPGKIYGVIRAAQPLESIRATSMNIFIQLGIASLVVLILVSTFSIILSRKFSNPLRDLRLRVFNLTHGDLSSRMDLENISGPKELFHLARSFNNMGDELEARIDRMNQFEQMRKDFVANVSHELRTPLTSIGGFIETLQEGEVSEEEQKKFYQIISRQTHRLTAIVNDLLMLSKIEKKQEDKSITFTQTPLAPVLNSAIEVLKPKAKKSEIEIQLHCDESIQLLMEPQLLEQAIVNLVDNAIKYSESHSQIKVTVTSQENSIRIDVSDEGVGIPEEHLPRIFERFYRVDKARSRKVGGTGLGLSIVKHIAILHKGTASIRSKINEGTTITLVLPKARLKNQ